MVVDKFNLKTLYISYIVLFCKTFEVAEYLIKFAVE